MLLTVLEATLSYFKQWLKVLKMGIFSSVSGWSWLSWTISDSGNLTFGISVTQKNIHPVSLNPSTPFFVPRARLSSWNMLINAIILSHRALPAMTASSCPAAGHVLLARCHENWISVEWPTILDASRWRHYSLMTS